MLWNILFCPAQERTARELRQLHQTEREKVWADMTGDPALSFYKLNPEIPQFLTERLQKLDEELAKSIKNVDDHHPIRFVPNEYLQRVRLMCLRADNYEPEPAASRMLKHFEIKSELFGMDKIGRDITLQDLEEEDLMILSSGAMQIVGSDHAGRRIFCHRTQHFQGFSPQALRRVNWYMFMSEVSEEKVQRAGMVGVVFDVGDYTSLNGNVFEVTRQFGKSIMALPVRLVAGYYCYDEAPWDHVVDLLSYVVSSNIRLRLRSVTGCHSDCMEQLEELGIPEKAVPYLENGSARLDDHQRWLFRRLIIEEEEEAAAKRAQNNYQILYSSYTSAPPTTTPTCGNFNSDVMNE